MHISVLKTEVLELLDPQSNENFIDATTGEAGHSLEILNKIKPSGKVLGIELDEKVYQKLEEKKIKNLIMVNSSFVNLKEIIQAKKFGPVSGILFDLGFLSWHVDESKKGFSFLKEEDLDMRFNTKTELTAMKIINLWNEEEILKILTEYGEEQFARNIARNIIKKRQEDPIRTTTQLSEIIKSSVPAWYRHKKIHPATKTFQALRITVNDELESIKKVLPQALEILKPGGRIAIISFHSLEDRIVKRYFKEKAQENLLKILTKKPLQASREEIINNPRSRSAKLRAAIKI